MRKGLLTKLMGKVKHSLSSADLATAARLAEGYSCSDLTALARDAAMNPIRKLGSRLVDVPETDIPPVTLSDIKDALTRVRRSVPPGAVSKMEQWNERYGFQT